MYGIGHHAFSKPSPAEWLGAFAPEPAAAEIVSSLLPGAAATEARGDYVFPIRHVHGALAWGTAPPEGFPPMNRLQWD